MLIQISAGRGPVECSLMVSKVWKELKKELKDDQKVLHKEKDHSPGASKECFKSILLEIDEAKNQLMSNWVGVIKCICQSPFRPNHKRRNWFVSIQIFEWNESLGIDENDLRIDTMKASGAGGQHVKKTNSAVRITHVPSELMTTCSSERSQTQNKKEALKDLKIKWMLLQKREHMKNDQQKWKQHDELERGNPIQVFRF
jgi:peptide chain release factor